MQAATLTATFKEVFGYEPTVFSSAPGRINLIGEHTDYHGGFVMPAAIDKQIYMTMAKRTDNQIRLFSMDFDELFESPQYLSKPGGTRWANYVLGVIFEVIQSGHEFTGVDMVLKGDVPLGAGLSSSAALEVCTLIGLDKLGNYGLSRLDMALLCQRAEHRFAGVQCGLMDMYASLFGKPSQLVQLDCRVNEHQYIPFNNGQVSIVLMDSGVKHELASTEYNLRRQECERASRKIEAHRGKAVHLRDLTTADLVEIQPLLTRVEFNRIRHVLEDNQRVMLGSYDLSQGNFIDFGKRMFEAHRSLSELYEVSCKELDILVKAASECEGVYGSRMMGGGFGGCTINLVAPEYADRFIKTVSSYFAEKTGKSTTPYQVAISDGAQATAI